VRQRGLLRLAHVLQQCACRADRQRQVVGAEAAKVERAELIRQQPRGARELEMPGRADALFAQSYLPDLARLIFGHE
jgi:hypothetical protein